VAAGFSPGEADQLRRSMAAWRRKGGLEKFEQRLIDGMGARGLSEAFARQIYQQILGFGEYGFPESHAASFALIVYTSAWLKRYHPAAFTGALLNSLPMGFYAPSQLVQGAHRAALDARDLARLADADALSALAGHRHGAVWDVAGVEHLPPLLAGGTFIETDPDLPPPTEGQDIVADYRTLSLTLRPHPLALLRERLRKRRLQTSAEIAATPHGRLVRTAGIVIGRQRPDTEVGVLFVTLEDEAGATNVIVWRDLGDRQRREMLSAKLLAVYGNVEREGEVVHVIAGRVGDLSPMLGALSTKSRDFH